MSPQDRTGRRVEPVIRGVAPSGHHHGAGDRRRRPEADVEVEGIVMAHVGGPEGPTGGRVEGEEVVAVNPAAADEDTSPGHGGCAGGRVVAHADVPNWGMARDHGHSLA